MCQSFMEAKAVSGIALCVEYGGTKSILASTNLSTEPLDMIRLYSYRFWIECTFRELKQQIGGQLSFTEQKYAEVKLLSQKRKGTSFGEHHAIALGKKS